MLKGVVYISMLFLVAQYASAQNFSNKGKEFWVGYGYHQTMVAQTDDVNSQNMVLYFTSDMPASVKVEIPGVGWAKTYQVSANAVTESDPMPKSGAQDARLFSEGTFNTGIHITSDNPIVAYAHIYSSTNSGASLLFPVNTLGQEYYSLNFTQRSNIAGSNSWAFVVATEDNTMVEITPSAATLQHPAGVTFTQQLNKGQIYNLMGTTNDKNGVDLTGTKIRSVSSGTAGCKRIAVYSGSGRVSINCENAVTSSDNLFQQDFPLSAWGKKFLTVPTLHLPNNYFRIAVGDPTTIVTIDGVRLTNLINNFYYEINADSPKSIVSDKPVTVAQYITSSNDDVTSPCGNSFNYNGDPEMIYLSPLEQTIDDVTLNSTPHFQIKSHFINVVIKTSAISSFTIDGASSASTFKVHPADPSYSYGVFEVKQGSHRLRADSGFNAIAYGYGEKESYGYNAGTNIKNLYEFLTVQNPYAVSNATCNRTPFTLAVTLPFKATSLVWDFGNNPNLTPSKNIVSNNPIQDSSYNIDGRVLFVYKIKDSLRFNKTGTFAVKIIATNQSSDGCSGEQEIDYDIQVINPPNSDFSISFAGCLKDTASFINTSNNADNTSSQVTRSLWDFGDITTDTIRNPIKTYKETGIYNVKLTSINNIGCSADVTKPITIAPMPTANFSFSAAIGCVKNMLTITDSSTVSEGKIASWFWVFGDGTSLTKTNATPFPKNYDSAGNYLVKLVVQTANGCKSDTFQKAITILSAPVTNFILPDICVNDPVATFTDSSYIPNGAGNSLTYSWNFGDQFATAANPNKSTDKNPQHHFSAAGFYNVSLTTTSTSGCYSTLSKEFAVNGIPKADVTVLDSGTLCSNSEVKIKNNSSVSPGSITKIEITWDTNDATSSVVTENTPVAGQIFSHVYPASATAQTYRVKVRAFSGINCSDVKEMTLTVKPAPKVIFSDVPTFCSTDSAYTITQARETSALEGTAIFSGDGVTPNGVFTPAIAGVGASNIKYTFTSTAGCKDSIEQTIRVVENPTVKLPQKVFALEGQPIIFEPVITGDAVKFTWSPSTWLDDTNIRTPKSTPLADTTYRLTVTSAEGCTAFGDVAVIYLKNLAVPNAFSPNGDGINDVWNIPALQSFARCTVAVFNRYGKIVFNSIGYNKPWDGSFNGSILPVGTYYYIINIGNGKKPYSGNVTILK